MERSSRHQWAVDLAVAAVLAGVGLAEIWLPMESVQGNGSNLVSSFGVVLFAVALSVRRSRPWWALTGLLVWPILGALVGAGHMHLLFFGQLVPVLVLAFTIARHGRGRYLWVGTAAVAGFIALADLFVPLMGEASELLFHWGVLILVWLTGRGLRLAADRAAAEAVRAHVAESAAREQALAAVAEERARIARELHDMIAHSVGVIVVQAGAAEQLVQDDPEFAQQALGTIRATGSEALVEMRRLVAMLRDPEVSGELSPQPGTNSLPELVEAARAAGLEVSLQVSGDRPQLPAGLDLTAYRIVQEGLTNVRRHSLATRAEVAMDFGADALEITVHDEGPLRDEDVAGAGHGLVGMRERAALYGGQVEAGPVGRGFTVRAVLPLEPVSLLRAEAP